MVGSDPIPMNKRVVSFQCLFNNKANASETEHNGKTAYIDSSLSTQQITNWFANQGKYVQGVSQQRGANTKGVESYFTMYNTV